jgi:hypothetical protein
MIYCAVIVDCADTSTVWIFSGKQNAFTEVEILSACSTWSLLKRDGKDGLQRLPLQIRKKENKKWSLGLAGAISQAHHRACLEPTSKLAPGSALAGVIDAPV